jgi:hypothetical protein
MVVDPSIEGDHERHMWPRVRCACRRARPRDRAAPGAGASRNPLSAGALREKFEECAAIASAAERVSVVREMVEGLDAAPTCAASPRF